MELLNRIRIVMINTSDSGNIGAAARAMKTMGVTDLVLVAPREFPTAKATARATGAADLLYKAKVVDTLDEAIADCQMVFGTSARMRTIPWPLMSPREASELVLNEPEGASIAIVFGREDAGLNNEELRRCHYHICIPGNQEYSVLNVAAAVQVICYEMRMGVLARHQGQQQGDPPSKPSMPLQFADWDEPLVSAQDMERFMTHFEETLLDIGFFDPSNPKQLMTRARRLFMRTRMDRLEMNLMRGVLSTVQKRIKGS
ncbi:MAG: tRNA (cytosine(32)/uridine(32)-2'-O)-methyltransferase TrmJ [Pseudomonadales bacterium]|jgi:tRNA (cytidine32/uridine32-2'-O)-methyltransferase|uniref:RNA methyltransferase n=1 Tax=unclassified Ketobacter TaxID=2639109 RepID=UPI000C5E94DF|nr:MULTISPECIES: RNA methyltransferase [unclassified Ketobacter]MAQ27281.1 tRNA (cytosine(32)/uridine(32)-2'-O)-methyltransferase TrmJ [Pseudomonadales bacterium]MEC8813528.1 RNA methyltransferase [Pseudomonadota bacterium]HAG96781.1 tRNA (cytosine(32)/uridine(32)-2'-O)-methyltransferase TrmJ [Gammaproteobacteria bacterium]MBI27115.1 tRNA (cytosine(32)/uridine(32)-2'-O)-methyltransferase TrmJ [Pseudomonadales bacterium]RLT88352.1 MAG: RNA methyltransferase [Ketobacter sp. GenoA1]|tara:strand:- start:37627 stop:38400 length:774 start_codon:yes stop_codon:yes gene_type:complete